MAHPKDIKHDGTCRVCGDKLTSVIRRSNGRLAFRRHMTNAECPTKGRGEPMRNR